MTKSSPLPRIKSLLVGLGKMGQGYAADPEMAKYFEYATHAQVLALHPAFDWQAMVDIDDDMVTAANGSWSVRYSGRCIADLGAAAHDIELAVLATNPGLRLAMIDELPNLKAVLVEKPLGGTLAEAESFLVECERRNIMVQVNLWRRVDKLYRSLAKGKLAKLIGPVQAASCVYGNGLLNNGTHMIDFARMLFGEVEGTCLLGPAAGFIEGPLPGDRNIAFQLAFRSGLSVQFIPLRFNDFRENGLIIWGSTGRLEILNEGLVVNSYGRKPNRAMQGEWEVASDQPRPLEPMVGTALYDMFDNLALAIDADDPSMLFSPGRSAFVTSQLVDELLHMGGA